MSDFEAKAKAALVPLNKQHELYGRLIFSVSQALQNERADAEREMREPGPCGLHPNACLMHHHYAGIGGFHGDRPCNCTIKPGMDEYCSACQRETELKEALRDAPDPTGE